MASQENEQYMNGIDEEPRPQHVNPQESVPSVSHIVATRHSTRAFLLDPVPCSIVKQVLQLAQRAPSSTNIQPWRTHLVSGLPLEKIKDSLVKSFDAGQPLEVTDIPEMYHEFRTQLGRELYGSDGWNIPRENTEAQHQTLRQNFRFYEAPLVAVVSIDKSLNLADIVSVGMYLQTLALLLAEHGLGTCFQVSTVGYSETLRKALNIEERMDILCSLAIGYEEESQQINRLRMSRRPWQSHVEFVTES